jgi:hypothetical protein
MASMITGTHILLYSENPEADRAFCRFCRAALANPAKFCKNKHLSHPRRNS